MESEDQLESIEKLRQRLIRLIKLGEPNPTRIAVDLTGPVEECVRRLFSNVCAAEQFIRDVQQILQVTIKSNLGLFLAETIPFAQEYLRQHHLDPFSWETFKVTPASTLHRLPSLEQARFRLPPSCPQLIDLTSSVSTEPGSFIAQLRPEMNLYQQRLVFRFARHQFHLNPCAESLFLQSLYRFIEQLIGRVLFVAQHRVDVSSFSSQRYEMTTNVREQIRFLIDWHRHQYGDSNNVKTNTDDEQKPLRAREYRVSVLEGLRRKEADETACLVLRESRLKRQKRIDEQEKTKVTRANRQDLIAVMENHPRLKRSKTLLFAYANR